MDSKAMQRFLMVCMLLQRRRERRTALRPVAATSRISTQEIKSFAFVRKSSPFVTTVSIAVITSFFLLIFVFLTFTCVCFSLS